MSPDSARALVAAKPCASAVTAATSANPIRITTAAAHGWVTGQRVEFDSMPGDFGTALNGNVFSVTVVSTTTLTGTASVGARVNYGAGSITANKKPLSISPPDRA